MRLKDKHTGKIKKVLKIVVEKENGHGEVFTSIKDLNEGYEDAPEEKNYGGRVPEIGDYYWFIEGYGNIANAYWDGTDVDKARFECGNAFWTFEEAEKELKRRKAYVILKEDTKGFKPDWGKGGEGKWYVLYRHSAGDFILDWCVAHNDGEKLYFATKEDAEASIKAHEKEWLDYLGIEEQ